MRDFEFLPADRVEPQRLHTAFGEAFADYLTGPFQLPFAQWPQFLGRQAVDLALSRVAVRNGEVLAFCFVAPRPALGRWRLATMGAAPDARGSGVAPALLDGFIARAKQDGQLGVELECFAQNPRALRLYQGRGFVAIHDLFGYARQAEDGLAHEDTPHRVSLEAAFAWLEGKDLPLQVMPTSLWALPVQLRAWRHGSAQLVFSEGDGKKISVHSFVEEEASQQSAETLVMALLRRYPGWRVQVPQLQRRDVGGAALERLGFERLPLHQVWMRRGV